MSLIVGLPIILMENSALVTALWFAVPVAMYSFVGNFAPFFEVGVGAHLDGRRHIQWLMPMLMFTFLYNIPICLKAFVDLLSHRALGRKHSVWVKTVHLGYGTCYITNPNAPLEVSK